MEVVQAILQGSGYVLPLWYTEETAIPLFESQVDCDPLPIMTIHPPEMELLTFKGRNARLAILEVIDLVQVRKKDREEGLHEETRLITNIPDYCSRIGQVVEQCGRRYQIVALDSVDLPIIGIVHGDQ